MVLPIVAASTPWLKGSLSATVCCGVDCASVILVELLLIGLTAIRISQRLVVWRFLLLLSGSVWGYYCLTAHHSPSARMGEGGVWRAGGLVAGVPFCKRLCYCEHYGVGCEFLYRLVDEFLD